MTSPPKDPMIDTSRADLAEIVLAIQEMLWKGDDGWDLDKAVAGADFIAEVGALLDAYGLAPQEETN